MSLNFYARFGLFDAVIFLKTLKQTYLMCLSLKERPKLINQHPNTANDPIAYDMSSKTYFAPKNAVLET